MQNLCDLSKRKEVVTMLILNKNMAGFTNTISYLLTGVNLWLITGLLLCSLLLYAIAGITLLVMQLSLPLIILGVFVNLLQIRENLIQIKTMKGTSKHFCSYREWRSV